MSNTAPILGQFEKKALAWVRRIFSDPNVAREITYVLYQGRDQDGPITSSFAMTAVCIKDEIGAIESEGSQIQQRRKEFLLRSSDLPTGTALADLTVNDRITDGTGDYVITSLDKTLGFVFKVGCLGDD